MKQTDITRMQYQHLLQQSPFIEFLNAQIVAVDEANSSISISMPFQQKFERMAGAKQYHGGPIACLIDTAGSMAIALVINMPSPTINFRTDYLRPAFDSDLTAIATVRRAGQTVGVVDIDVIDAADNLIAVGRGAFATTAG